MGLRLKVVCFFDVTVTLRTNRLSKLTLFSERHFISDSD